MGYDDVKAKVTFPAKILNFKVYFSGPNFSIFQAIFWYMHFQLSFGPLNLNQSKSDLHESWTSYNAWEAILGSFPQKNLFEMI